jgi:hypothetical protein
MFIRPLRSLGAVVFIALVGLAPAAHATPMAPIAPPSVSDTASGAAAAQRPALVERVRQHRPRGTRTCAYHGSQLVCHRGPKRF